MRDMLTCIIIDDDELDRLAVEAELVNFSNIKILGSFNHPIAAIACISSQKPDILFLDIDMPDMNGIDFVTALGDISTVNVFITSHPEFAWQGFQLKVFDFILKPIETDRFESCIQRIFEFKTLKDKAKAYDVLFEKEKIIFKEGHNVVSINANEVVYLEAYGDYTKIVTEKKSHLTLVSLSNLFDSLPSGKFVRIHRSYIIALDKIKSINTKKADMGNNILPVGKTYARETRKIFNIN